MNSEICEECYLEHFPVYADMEIIVSAEICKCSWCGNVGQVVRVVTAGGEVIDIN